MLLGEILSKNISVYENAVTGIWWSCMLLFIDSWFQLTVSKTQSLWAVLHCAFLSVRYTFIFWYLFLRFKKRFPWDWSTSYCFVSLNLITKVFYLPTTLGWELRQPLRTRKIWRQGPHRASLPRWWVVRTGPETKEHLTNPSQTATKLLKKNKFVNKVNIDFSFPECQKFQILIVCTILNCKKKAKNYARFAQ